MLDACAPHELQVRYSSIGASGAPLFVIDASASLVLGANAIDAGQPLMAAQAQCASAGENVVASDPGSCALTATDFTTDPLLAPPADNGGPQQTMLPAVASDAVDAVSELPCPATDARGFLRNSPGTGGRCDAGAVELGASAP